MRTVCFFSGDITRGGGTERVSTLIANGLAAQKRWRVIFLSLVEQGEKPFFELDEEIGHYALGDRWIRPGPGYLAVLPKLKRFLRENGVEVLVDIDIVLDALSLPVAGSTGTKVISWGHFSYYFEQESLYRRMILRYSARRADYCVTINMENNRCYEKYLHRTDNIRTIYNPVVRHEAGDEAPLQRENWILWVGRLVDIKGVDYLAETAVRVLRKYPDWQWIVVGEGEKRPFLENIIAENHLEGRLVLMGEVSDVGAFYARARIFALTSRSEGLPMCLLEAKSFGVPCVSFDIRTGPSEIIRDGVNGYLIPPYDCDGMARRIGGLIEDSSLLERFAAQTGLDQEKFEMGAVLKSWNEVIENLCM